MVLSTRTPEGWPNRCPLCGKDVRIEPSPETLDAPCPHCGGLLWFASSGDVAPILDPSRSPSDLVPADIADDISIPTYLLELIPHSVAWENRVLPVAETRESLIVALADPTDIDTVDKLQFILNRRIQVVHVAADWLDDQLRQRYGNQ